MAQNKKFMIYDIYLLRLGFHPVAVVGRLVLKQERDSTKGETIHKTKKTLQKQRIQKIENKNTKQKRT